MSDVLKAALEEIAALRGKTLIRSYHDSSYEEGSARAFGEAAWIAESALSKFEEKTAS